MLSRDGSEVNREIFTYSIVIFEPSPPVVVGFGVVEVGLGDVLERV